MYSLSPSEMNFVSLFRRLKVETLWVEVRKNPDRIVSFIYVPSGKNSDFIFSTRLTEIAPVFVLYPVGNMFIFGTTTGGKSFRTVLSKEEVVKCINEDWNGSFLRSFLSEKHLLFFEKGREVFPKKYNQMKAKKIYSDLHLSAKRNAYMFDIDVALLEGGGTDFLALLEYKHGRETGYRRDLLSYNERLGYSFLKEVYKTFLIVGSSSFSVYDFKGFDEELIGKVSREKVEDFLTEVLREPIARIPEVRF